MKINKIEKINEILDALVDVDFFGGFYNTSPNEFELWTSDGMDDCYVVCQNGVCLYNEYDLSKMFDDLGYNENNMIIMENIPYDTVYIFNIVTMEYLAFYIGENEKIKMYIRDVDDMVGKPFENFMTFVNLMKKMNEI